MTAVTVHYLTLKTCNRYYDLRVRHGHGSIHVLFVDVARLPYDKDTNLVIETK